MLWVSGLWYAWCYCWKVFDFFLLFLPARLILFYFYRNWGSGLSNESVEYYKEFIEVVATTNYTNFDRFKPYVNEKTLENVNMLSIARDV